MLVMKIDGKKETFRYDSKYWANQLEYNPIGGQTGFDSQETKLMTYWNTSFTKICLGMKVDQQINFIAVEQEASSLFSLIADGQHRATSLGRNTWKSLIGSEASLQRECNMEGFNVVSSDDFSSKARIGIISNEQNDCSSCDSRIGFGIDGSSLSSNRCGNVARYSPDNGEKNINVMGYIFVR